LFGFKQKWRLLDYYIGYLSKTKCSIACGYWTEKFKFDFIKNCDFLKNLPIYLDYAATTPVAEEVLADMLPYFSSVFGNPSSRHHAFGWFAEEAVDTALSQISESLGVLKSEIVFASGATESINLALKGFLSQNTDYKLITIKTEHKATLDVAQQLTDAGREVVYLDVDATGNISIETLEKELQKGPALVAMLLVNNETGLIHPIEEIGALVHRYGGKVHVDATQAVGKMPLNFREMQIDLLSFSAHKIYGPKGVGALLVKKDIKIAAQIAGGGHQRGRRSGTLNVPGIVGLGKAVKLSVKNLNENQAHLRSLKARFEEKVIVLGGKINSEGAERAVHISNICFVGKDGEDLLMKLHKIAISNGSACNSASTLPSHVLKAMGYSDADAYSSLRFSFGVNTKTEDIDKALEHLAEVIFQ
jgi:cysteine desulfurase